MASFADTIEAAIQNGAPVASGKTSSRQPAAGFVDAATAALASGDPYGKNTAGATGTSASFRQRGDATQKRVNNDTRVRSDANSGTAGANGTAATQTMSGALGGEQTQLQVPQPDASATWQATRQPVDVASVRQRVLQSLKPQQGN